MSDWGVFTSINGLPFDAINSLSDDYVIDVIEVSSNGSRSYPVSENYNIDAFVSNSSDKYAGGGQYDNPITLNVSNGVVSWNTSKPGFVIVVMKNV